MRKTWKFDFDIAKYSGIIESHPENYCAYNNRAIAYQKRGQYELSIADFDKATELNPSFVQAYIIR